MPSPGPVKTYYRYINIPITNEHYTEFENLKYRVRLSKTELVRRFIDYCMLMPFETQLKMLASFDDAREREYTEKRVLEGRTKKTRHSGLAGRKTYDPNAERKVVTPIRPASKEFVEMARSVTPEEVANMHIGNGVAPTKHVSAEGRITSPEVAMVQPVKRSGLP